MSTTPPWDFTQSRNISLPECISFRALSLSSSGTCKSALLPSLRLANSMPLSSKHSLIAPKRYAGPSWCLCGSLGAGMSPSCPGDRLLRERHVRMGRNVKFGHGGGVGSGSKVILGGCCSRVSTGLNTKDGFILPCTRSWFRGCLLEVRFRRHVLLL